MLRELPSSPVPTPCCTALLEAQSNNTSLHTDSNHRPCCNLLTFFLMCAGLEGKGTRIQSMKSAVTDTFPEPNRRLLQR